LLLLLAIPWTLETRPLGLRGDLKKGE